MHTDLCDRLDIEFPIFAFTHCRDVVVAVSQAGGFGVLGAVGFTPEQLEIELRWIDEHIGDNPYGVDIVIPGKYEGKSTGETDPKKLEEMLKKMIPEQHRAFARKILDEHHVPDLPTGEERRHELLGWTEATATPQVEVALKHPKVKLIANALGTPPQEVIDHIHAAGRLVSALCGRADQALKHKAAGVDIIIAQGTEGGGHTGEIGSMVLWPEVIDAVAPTPVLAAGGVGRGRQIAAALGMGAQGVWTGSIWLTVEEAEASPEQMDSYLQATSRDTVRSRSWTGKPCRMLKNDWTVAWESEESPGPLGMPLQGMLVSEAMSRVHRYPKPAQKVAFNPVGQIVGAMNEKLAVRDVIYTLVEEYVDAVDRLQKMQG
jgi:NAD(P)H-dependent flavin oxidoreductase YrpB (nitropropane dioxygenase family)